MSAPRKPSDPFRWAKRYNGDHDRNEYRHLNGCGYVMEVTAVADHRAVEEAKQLHERHCPAGSP